QNANAKSSDWWPREPPIKKWPDNSSLPKPPSSPTWYISLPNLASITGRGPLRWRKKPASFEATDLRTERKPPSAQPLLRCISLHRHRSTFRPLLLTPTHIPGLPILGIQSATSGTHPRADPWLYCLAHCSCLGTPVQAKPIQPFQPVL